MADFLCHLRDDKDQATSTIAGYRTAISQVLKSTSGIDLGTDAALSSLIANFKRDPSNSVRNIVPRWDLMLVLEALNSAPFEPLAQASLSNTTYKAVFLLALASGRRRSEIHAVAFDSIQYSDVDGSLILYPQIGFLAKTQLAEDGRSCLDPITVPPLSNVLSPDMDEKKSCPVRALQYYLKKTEGFRSDTVRLFVSHRTGKDIAKGTISGWIKRAVALAYQHTPGLSTDQKRMLRVKAHEVRAFSASWALLKGVPLDSILRAGRWRSHTTFTNYYLKDLTQRNIKSSELSLAPLVVASTVTM